MGGRKKQVLRYANYVTLHYLYITRGVASSLLLAFWAAWFVLRQRRKSEEDLGVHENGTAVYWNHSQVRLSSLRFQSPGAGMERVGRTYVWLREEKRLRQPPGDDSGIEDR